MSKHTQPPPELFFDRLLRHYQNGYTSIKQPSPESWEDCCGVQAEILNCSTPFFINGAVADDLYNIPRDQKDIDCLSHFPFPVIYFELMDPLEIIVGSEYKRSVKGIVIGKEDILFPQSLSKAFGKDYLNVLLYDTNTLQEQPPYDLPDAVYFGSDTPYNLGFNSKFFQYLPQESELQDVQTSTFDPLRGLLQNPLSATEQQNVREHFKSITHFCLNLIDYINAHNITLRQVERETKDTTEIERINRKRETKGKRPLSALKPFYWVDITEKTITLTEQNSNNSLSDENTLTYREWVRGHFQRYHTRNGTKKNWIDPYTRGPSTAPWKENRYIVLEEMLQQGKFPTNA
ncbi:hypothetical protein HYX11_03885 [Candidatus Woesearchaeota archaeon]|nr:hypothetical protein [Candidatus Woesearchaeota archaeon]